MLDLVPRGIEVSRLRNEHKLHNGTLRNEHKLRSDSSAMSSKLLCTCNCPVPAMACRVGEEGVGDSVGCESLFGRCVHLADNECCIVEPIERGATREV